MTHFPQPHPTRRAARVQLGVPSSCDPIRYGQRSRGKLYSISVTGGLLKTGQAFGHGTSSRSAFRQGRNCHCMAEMLSPARKATDGLCSRSASLRWRRRSSQLRMALQSVSDQSYLGTNTSQTSPRSRCFSDRNSLASSGAVRLSLYLCRLSNRHDHARDHNPFGGGNDRLGANAGPPARPPKLVLLRGDLGAGKPR